MPSVARLVLALLFLVPLCGQALGQEDGPPSLGGATGPRTGKRAPRAEVPVNVPLKGLDQEHAGAFVAAVQGLTHPLYVCAGCEQKSREGGTCPRCEGERQAQEPTPTVARVNLTIDRRSLAVTVRPHDWIGLGELDRLAREQGAEVDRATFRIPTYARISVTGGGEKDALRLRSTLQDLKVFSALSVTYDEASGLCWIQPRPDEDSAVTLAAVEEALGKLPGELAVEDVLWAGYCPDCGREPSAKVTDPTCRRAGGGQ